jgi:hypothetical protein
MLVLGAALACCDGTLQFSSPGGTTGGAAGRASDASADDGSTADMSVPSDMAAPADTVATDTATPDDTAPLDVAEDRSGGFAPPCQKDSDCPVNKLHCDLVTAQCVECVGDLHCNVDPYRRCDTGVHRCVECLSPNDCAPGAFCHPATRICIAQCADGGGCPAAQPFCDTRGLCVECRNNADCFRPDLCDVAIGRCAYCAVDLGCLGPNLHCDPYNPNRDRCKQCLTPSDCTASVPYCDVHAGTCVNRDSGL